MFKEPGKALCHRVHRYNMALQQEGSSHHMVPNHHRDMRMGNSRLMASNTHLQVDTLGKDINRHSIHFTEGECSDT